MKKERFVSPGKFSIKTVYKSYLKRSGKVCQVGNIVKKLKECILVACR